MRGDEANNNRSNDKDIILNQTPPPQTPANTTAPNNLTFSPLTLDYKRYAALLDDKALCADQRCKMIEALWSMMTAFVDLGFGLHPVQQACGQNRYTGALKRAADSAPVVSSDTTKGGKP